MKKPIDYFNSPTLIAHKQFEALRMFFVEKVAGKQVAKKFGYTYRGFTTIVSNFRTPLIREAVALMILEFQRRYFFQTAIVQWTIERA